MICSFCGQEVKEGAKFCQSCGKSTADMMPASSVAPVAPAMEAPVAPVAPTMEATAAPTIAPVVAAEIPAIDIPAPVASPVVADPYAQQPAVNTYAQPAADPYASNAYAQPAATPFTPVQSAYTQPVSAYAQPTMNNGYAQPATNVYGQNTFNQTAYGNNSAAYTQSGVYTATASASTAAAYAQGVAAQSEEDNKAATPVLVFGIVSLCLSLSCCFSLVGLVFGIVSLVKASALEKANGYLISKAKTGKGLSIAGVIIGAIWTVCGLIFCIALAVAIAEEL